MKALITTIVLSMTFLTGIAQPKLADKVIGVVGDEIVLLSDVELQYQQFKAQGENTEGLKCSLLDQMLLEKLFLTQAILDSVLVGDDEVSGELDRRISYFISMFGTREKLEEYYEKSILELKDEFREDIYNQLLAEKMQRQIFTGMTVTPAEVKKFFREIPEDSLPYFNAEVELAQIVVYPEISDVQREYARQKLADIRKKIVEEGADFGTQAFFYSEDKGSAEQNGDLGYIQRGEMVKEFEAAAFRLEKNEVSEIVETEFGFHILYLEDKRGQKVKIKHILIIPQITSFETEAAKSRIDSIRNLLVNDSMTFNKAVKLFSEDEQSKNNNGLTTNPQTGTSWYEMDEVDGTVAFSLEKMNVGDYSPILPYESPRGKKGLRIILLKDETEPHKASLDTDYSKIQAAALQAKQKEAMNDWVKDKKSETYVMIDKSWRDCPVVTKWLSEN